MGLEDATSRTLLYASACYVVIEHPWLVSPCVRKIRRVAFLCEDRGVCSPVVVLFYLLKELIPCFSCYSRQRQTCWEVDEYTGLYHGVVMLGHQAT